MSNSAYAKSPPSPPGENVIGVCSALSPYTLDPSGRIAGAGTVHMSARAPRGTTPQCSNSFSEGRSVSTRTLAEAPGASDSTSTRMPTRIILSTSVCTTCDCEWNSNQSTFGGRRAARRSASAVSLARRSSSSRALDAAFAPGPGPSSPAPSSFAFKPKRPTRKPPGRFFGTFSPRAFAWSKLATDVERFGVTPSSSYSSSSKSSLSPSFSARSFALRAGAELGLRLKLERVPRSEEMPPGAFAGGDGGAGEAVAADA